MEQKEKQQQNFLATIGRRKSAIARVRLTPNGTGIYTVNGLEAMQYFTTIEMRELVMAPLKAVGRDNNVDISVKVVGGGKKGQAEATRLGVSRALIQLDETLRKSLKTRGYLSRDARVKERKKPGLRKARRASQWSKR